MGGFIYICLCIKRFGRSKGRPPRLVHSVFTLAVCNRPRARCCFSSLVASSRLLRSVGLGLTDNAFAAMLIKFVSLEFVLCHWHRDAHCPGHPHCDLSLLRAPRRHLHEGEGSAGQRSTARFLWHCHRKGLLVFSALRLARIGSVLEGHHSRDPSLFAEITATMAASQTREP